MSDNDESGTPQGPDNSLGNLPTTCPVCGGDQQVWMSHTEFGVSLTWMEPCERCNENGVIFDSNPGET